MHIKLDFVSVPAYQQNLGAYIFAACGEAAAALSTSLPQPNSLKVRLLITHCGPLHECGHLEALVHPLVLMPDDEASLQGTRGNV